MPAQIVMGEIMTPFHVGMKVVCIHTFAKKDTDVQSWPVYKATYTIREIVAEVYWGDRVGLFFEEITNPPSKEDGYEPCFDAIRFRPVVKTDISIFTSMLTRSPAQLDEVVT